MNSYNISLSLAFRYLSIEYFSILIWILIENPCSVDTKNVLGTEKKQYKLMFENIQYPTNDQIQVIIYILVDRK